MDLVEKRYIKIISKGHPSSWYNNYVGEEFELYKIFKKGNYDNYVVKSNDKGTKNGYKIPFKNISLGKGYDLVHEFAGEIVIKTEFVDNKE